MKMRGIFVVLSFVAVWVCGFAMSRDEAFVMVQQGIREFITTGNSPEYFRLALVDFQLPHIFREDPEEPFEDVQVCTLCNLVVDLLILERQAGLDREALFNEVTFLCDVLGIEKDRVCRGTIDENIDTFLYIIDNQQNLTSDHFCGVIMQSSGCKTVPDSDWSIPLPPKPETTKIDAGGNGNFTILHLSDVHYDPQYLPGGNAVCDEPLCCQDDQPAATSEEEMCGYWTDYRHADAPWHLIEEAVRHSRTQNPDYVYYTGDIISHRMWETSQLKNARDIGEFYQLLKERFDGIPVFPVFGNHEPHPLNVWTAETVLDEDLSLKWLFELAAEHWSILTGVNVSETALKGGYYTVTPEPGFRVIAINSNLCYTVNWWLIFDSVDPFDQLQWLVDTLKLAEENNEKVHILSHVPSGHESCLKVWSREYRKIIERFSDTISAQFNGHTHKDEFHVYYATDNSSEPVSVAFNGASVTPYSSCNPSYKVYSVEKETFLMLDYEEWTFNLTAANARPQTETPDWYKLYTFTEAYGAQDLSPAEVNKILYSMVQNTSLIDDYFRFYYRNGDDGLKNGCGSKCHKNFLCSIATTQTGDSTQCDFFTGLYDEVN